MWICFTFPNCSQSLIGFVVSVTSERVGKYISSVRNAFSNFFTKTAMVILCSIFPYTCVCGMLYVCCLINNVSKLKIFHLVFLWTKTIELSSISLITRLRNKTYRNGGDGGRKFNGQGSSFIATRYAILSGWFYFLKKPL